MTKNALVFGLIAGALITGMMLYAVSLCYSQQGMEPNDVMGYAAMIVAFSFIFVGVKNYRDKYQHGIISFGKAFKLGLLITLVAATMYVVTWLIAYYNFFPDFMDKYCARTIELSEKRGASEVELATQMKNSAQMKEWYKNPLFVVLITYSEVLPIGLIVAVISALILKRKTKKHENIAG